MEQDDPRTSDGKRIFLPNLFPGNVLVTYPGAGDDLTTGAIATGPTFGIQSTAIEDKSVSWQFKDWVYVAGGEMTYSGAQVGDYIEYKLYAPPTVGTSVAGTGAFDKVEVIPGSGLNIYVPNPTNTGSWDIDLTETYSSAVSFTKAVPVPNSTTTGFFDYDTSTNALTVNATQSGAYDLFDFQIDLHSLANKIPMLGSHRVNLTVPAIKPKKALAQWVHKVTLHHTSTTPLDVVWFVYIAREKTV